jgi:hypothetical protein
MSPGSVSSFSGEHDARQVRYLIGIVSDYVRLLRSSIQGMHARHRISIHGNRINCGAAQLTCLLNVSKTVPQGYEI